MKKKRRSLCHELWEIEHAVQPSVVPPLHNTNKQLTHRTTQE